MDELFLDFINTSWCINHAPYKDPLLDRQATVDLFVHADIELQSDSIDSGKLISFREQLAEAIDQLIDLKRIQAQSIAAFNEHLDKVLLYTCFELADGIPVMVEKPQSFNTEYLIYLVLKSFNEFISAGDWANLRRCGSEGCRWLFVDKSKSHTRKWCSNTCASLIKVRNFRTRKSPEK